MSLLIVFQLRTGDQPQVEVGDASSLSGAASRNGMAQTKLPGYLGRQLKIPMTVRNWNTIDKLIELSG